MNLSCTIFLIVDKVPKQDVLVYQNLLNNCGVKYELFTCEETPIPDETKILNPNIRFGKHYDFPKGLNEGIFRSTTEYILFINEPFIAETDWLKDSLNFLINSEANCLIMPYLSYRNELHKTQFLNPYGEIMDVLVTETKQNDILGMHIFRKNTFFNMGGFMGYQYSNLEDCLIHYRKKIENVVIYDKFLKTIRDNNFSCEINTNFLSLQPVKDFSPVEEIAYHNLDDFLVNKLSISANKFAFDFLGVFGFRCDTLNSRQLSELGLYATHYNLDFEIKYAFLENEKRVGQNIFVIMKQKK